MVLEGGEGVQIFQFQYGTVERDGVQVSHLSAEEFQFQYGTVESFSLPKCISIQLYFNSSMVRLKVMPRTSCMTRSRFQFQYGTVERNSGCTLSRWNTRISIPVWYGWKIATLAVRRFLERISIPVWYGWKRSSKRNCIEMDNFNSSMVRLKANAKKKESNHYQISIPVWYGWKLSVRFSVFIIKEFQFQYGTVERKTLSITLPAVPNFNSSMVRLKVNFVPG